MNEKKKVFSYVYIVLLSYVYIDNCSAVVVYICTSIKLLIKMLFIEC